MAKNQKVSAEQLVRDIRREPRHKYSAEEKIRIVLEGLAGSGIWHDDDYSTMLNDSE